MINPCYSHPGKELKTHLEKVREIGLQVYMEKSGLNFPFPSEDLELSLKHMLYYHDIGKSTTYFQDYLQCSIAGREYREKRDLRSHALISALYAGYRTFLDLTGQSREILPVIVFLSVYKHHGDFGNLENMVVITKNEFKVLA